MSLANIFYLLGIVYMTMGIVLLVAIVVAVFYIKNRIDTIYKLATDKIERVTNAGEAAIDLGTTVVEKFLNRKKKK